MDYQVWIIKYGLSSSDKQVLIIKYKSSSIIMYQLSPNNRHTGGMHPQCSTTNRDTHAIGHFYNYYIDQVSSMMYQLTSI